MGKLTARSLLPLFSYFFVFSTPLFLLSRAADTIDGVRSLRDGETLESAGGSFLLGFYSIGGGSTKRYLCIRSTKGQEQPIVWVANRGRVLNDSGGILRFDGDGNLVVLDHSGGTVWSTGLAPNASTSRVAKLFESGNLVVGDAGDDLSRRSLWQSFDVPGNILLPGMKILLNTRSGASRHLTSWKSDDDPSPGNYSYRIEVNKLPRLVLLEGSKVRFSTGPWVGDRFAGTPSYNANGVFNVTVDFSGDEVYFTDNMIASSSLVTVVLEPSGAPCGMGRPGHGVPCGRRRRPASCSPPAGPSASARTAPSPTAVARRGSTPGPRGSGTWGTRPTGACATARWTAAVAAAETRSSCWSR